MWSTGLHEISIKNNTEKQPLQARFRALFPRRNPLVSIIASLRPKIWRLRAESNRRTRLCRPLHDHSATQPLHFLLSSRLGRCSARYLFGSTTGSPFPVRHITRMEIDNQSHGQKKPRSNRGLETGAGNEIRTRDPNLGKVVLYH